MTLTKSTKVITRKELSDKIFKALANDDNACVDDPDNDDDTLQDLQGDVENLLAFRSSNARKWVDLGLEDYIPLSDFKNHYHEDDVGGTELDNGVIDVDLD